VVVCVIKECEKCCHYFDLESVIMDLKSGDEELCWMMTSSNS
jgi:hypothetical protein